MEREGKNRLGWEMRKVVISGSSSVPNVPSPGGMRRFPRRTWKGHKKIKEGAEKEPSQGIFQDFWGWDRIIFKVLFTPNHSMIQEEIPEGHSSGKEKKSVFRSNSRERHRLLSQDCSRVVVTISRIIHL